MKPFLRVALVLTALLASACGQNIAVQSHREQDDLAKKHSKAFAEAEKLGDDAGGPGEKVAMNYVKTYFEHLGLETFLRTVPLVDMTPSSTFVEVSGAGGLVSARPKNGVDYLVWPGQQTEQIDVRGGVVFAGYGILSPEYTRDDYKDLDVRGKVVLVLEGTPRSADQDSLGKLGESYYGRRFYKFAEGWRHGAAAVLIIHGELQPWADMVKQSAGDIIDIDAGIGKEAPKAAVEGWVSQPAARRLLKAAGLDYDKLATQAHELAFQPTVLENTVLEIKLTNKIDRMATSQIFAVLRGQTAEYVMLSSQWNGLPFVPNTPDQALTAHDEAVAAAAAVHESIAARARHGALHPTDILAGLTSNGSGAALVLETARRIVATHQTRVRTLLFTVSTSLKPGVVGMQYYSDHPMFPLEKTIAQIFIDQASPSDAKQGVGKVGTSADDALSQMLRTAAIEQGRLVVLDQNSERRFYYKYSQSAFASHGVPTLYITTPPQSVRLVQMGAPAVNTDAASITAGDPDLDAILLTNLTTRVADATNWRAPSAVSTLTVR